MAGETSGTYFTANAVVDKTAAGTFIPEIWSDEIIAAYQKNLKMHQNIVKTRKPVVTQFFWAKNFCNSLNQPNGHISPVIFWDWLSNHNRMWEGSLI